MPLQIRRGLQAQRQAMTVPLAEGELLYVTDDQQLYIGNGTTSPVLVSAYSDQQAQDAAAELLLGPTPISSPDNTRHSGITFVYDDANNRLDATVNFGEISVLEVDAFKGDLLADDDAVLVNASTKEFSGTLIGNVQGNLVGNVQGNLVGDTKGSVFADDSTLLVDAVNASIPYSVLSGAPVVPTIGNYVFNGDTVTVTGVDNAPILENNAIGATASSGGVEINFNSNTVSHSMWLNGQDGLYLEINRHLLDTGGQVDWNFNTSGGLTFPDATVQTTAYLGPQTTLDGDVTGSVFADNSTMLVDGTNGKIVGPVDTASVTFPDATVQTTAYAGGQGRAFMIDTNRVDAYTENGSADRPFKSFVSALSAAQALASAVGAPAGDKRFTFILMGCTVTENVDFSGTKFTAITISTTCRSVITGNVTISIMPDLSQVVMRNIEIGGTLTITGDGTEEQMNNVSFYNTSFSGAVIIESINAAAFYEVAFFGAVTFTNISYFYINGAQFNTDWTIRVDDTGFYPIPSRGISPAVSIVFGTIANNVIFVKGGTAAFVFQPHMSRMGVGPGTYTVPADWIMTPHSAVLRGNWVNNGAITMRNSSSDNEITGTAPAFTGIIGGDRVVADLAPADSTGAAGDTVGMIAVGGGYLYVCTANWASPGTTDIWTRTTLTTGAW